MKIKSGTVKYPAGNKVFESKYSDKPQQNIVISMDDGTEEKIYFDQGRYPHSQLKKGQPVQIVYELKNGKEIRKLVADVDDKPVEQPAPAPAPAPVKSSVSPEAFIRERAAIMGVVIKLVSEVLPGASSEDVRAIASGILIEGTRQGIAFSELLSKPAATVDDDEPVF